VARLRGRRAERLAASDGVELWRTDVGLPLKAGPLVLGNAVLVADFDGNVHAYASPAR